MKLSDLTEPKLLLPRLLNDRPAGALQELIRRLEITGRIAGAPGLVESILKREAELPTLLDHGVAVPHVRGNAVKSLSLAIGYSATGIVWAPGQTGVELLFFFAVPLAQTQRYLTALSAVARLVQDQAALENLKACRQPEAMWRQLEQIPLPDAQLPLQPQ